MVMSCLGLSSGTLSVLLCLTIPLEDVSVVGLKVVKTISHLLLDCNDGIEFSIQQ